MNMLIRCYELPLPVVGEGWGEGIKEPPFSHKGRGSCGLITSKEAKLPIFYAARELAAVSSDSSHAKHIQAKKKYGRI